MRYRAKFLALEGIDGAGKRTQLNLLVRLLAKGRVPHARISFPKYKSFFGRMVGRFLNGEFGPLEAVDPHFSALLFAGDRLEAKAELEAALNAGKVVLADRYIGSNLAHQTARMASRRRRKFLAWLRELEYDVFGLPPETLVIYLRVPVRVAHRLVGRKAARAYTRRERDLQEADLAHLIQAAQVYEQLARGANWATVDCTDRRTGALLAPEEIHRAVVATIERRAPQLLRAQQAAPLQTVRR